jgi:hypothetical protein
MYPSDLFGDYYLVPIDRLLSERNVPSARYVDDIYIFVASVDEADKLLRALIPALRSYDLVLNEAKSIVMPKSALVTEEPDLEALFSAAVEEIASQVEDSEFTSDYGFQSEWDDEDSDEESDQGDLELQATRSLFDSLSEYPGNEENIERFCLPLFAAAESDYAVTHVMESFKKRPAMAQIYAAYLVKFIENNAIAEFLIRVLTEGSPFDWQKLWVLAALSQRTTVSNDAVKAAMEILRDAHLHEALRAVAAIFVGRFGDHARRTELGAIYGSVANYIQSAIYYSSRSWRGVERRNAKANWSGHGPLHNLLTTALGKAS